MNDQNKVKKLLVILVIVFAVIGIIIWLAINSDAKITKYKVGPKTEDTTPSGQVFENQGQTHIKVGESHPPYNSNPPTSGWHYAVPANWGVYDKPLADEQAVHNLEHGGIWISYKNIDEETKANLEKITIANRGAIIMSPREANDAAIVVAAWTRLEKLDNYDEAKILDFILRNKGNGPEKIVR